MTRRPVEEILASLRSAGAVVTRLGPTFVLDAPEGLLSDWLLGELRDRKAEVLAALRWEAMGRDPRPDIAADHAAWDRAIAMAYVTSGDDPDGLCQALHGLRCLGAAMETAGGRWVIRPGELDPTEYAELRERWLRPRAAGVAALLDRAAAEGGSM